VETRARIVIGDRRSVAPRIGRCGGDCAQRNRRSDFQDSAAESWRDANRKMDRDGPLAVLTQPRSHDAQPVPGVA
jgi:hypothetical protein